MLRFRPFPQGFVRVYQPHYDGHAEGEEVTEVGFRPDDLLLEVQLDQPVLQVITGRFVRSVLVCSHGLWASANWAWSSLTERCW